MTQDHKNHSQETRKPDQQNNTAGHKKPTPPDTDSNEPKVTEPYAKNQSNGHIARDQSSKDRNGQKSFDSRTTQKEQVNSGAMKNQSENNKNNNNKSDSHRKS